MSELNGATATLPQPAADTPAPTPRIFGPVAGVSKDRDGRVFDAAKFLPEKDTNGRWKRIGGPGKPGRPRKSDAPAKPAESQPAASELPPADFSDVEKIAAGATPDAGSPAGGNGPQPEPAIPGIPAPRDEYDRAAIATVSSVATLGIIAMGAHVAPKTDEIAAMVKAYADCYRAYGYAPETPPWLGPVIATATWVGPHMQDQRTQSKLLTWKIRIAAMWAKFRGRRDTRAAVAVAEAANQTASA